MLIPNLAVLLAERRLTLSRVSQDTRISRTTLTALTGQSAKGIQFDTLNTLCQYLKVTPEALFTYRPFDLSLAMEDGPGGPRIVFTVTRTGSAAERFALACDARRRFAPERPGETPQLEALDIRLSPPGPGDPDAPTAAQLGLLQSLPPSVLAGLELQILARFDADIDPSLAPRDYAPSLLWPWQ